MGDTGNNSRSEEAILFQLPTAVATQMEAVGAVVVVEVKRVDCCFPSQQQTETTTMAKQTMVDKDQ